MYFYKDTYLYIYKACRGSCVRSRWGQWARSAWRKLRGSLSAFTAALWWKRRGRPWSLPCGDSDMTQGNGLKWGYTIKVHGNSDLTWENKFSNTNFPFSSANCGFLCGIQVTFIKMFSVGEVTKHSVATAGSVSGQLLNCEELINAAPALQLKRWKRHYCYKFSLTWSQWEGTNLTFISPFFQFHWNTKMLLFHKQRLLPICLSFHATLEQSNDSDVTIFLLFHMNLILYNVMVERHL